MRFKSKVDWWIGLILIATPVVTFGAAMGVLVTGGPWLTALLPFGLIALIYGGLVFPMYYELTDDAVLIRFGLVRSRVRYATIQRVVPTRNPLSNPAFSLDRLHLDAGNALGPFISPLDKKGFLEALAAKTPHLTLAGDRLIPKSSG